VIPVSFDYVEATSVDHALALFAEHDDAKFLAGGHSLVPMMKLRLVSSSVLIDIGRIAELSFIEDRGDHIAVGALTRHRVVEGSSLLAEHLGLLTHVAGQVGDPQVRNRGTLGGSLVHGDPAADLPSAALALGASMVITGATGTRVVPAAEFFVNFLETAVGDGELLTEVRFPKRTGDGWAYQKFNRREPGHCTGQHGLHASPRIGCKRCARGGLACVGDCRRRGRGHRGVERCQRNS
jgi:carbon-monoxide dehydrogenase medium subunit